MFSFPPLIAALGAVSKMSHASVNIVQQISPAANTLFYSLQVARQSTDNGAVG